MPIAQDRLWQEMGREEQTQVTGEMATMGSMSEREEREEGKRAQQF
jgi:hypothetical protein